MKVVLAAVCLAVCAVAGDDIEAQFQKFMSKHGKFYENDAERRNRFENFKQSLANIDAKNVEESSQEVELYLM
jgi:uncharacterized protein with von Willebrand factor type A (vWA) domain